MRSDAPAPSGGDEAVVAFLMVVGTILVAGLAGVWQLATFANTGRFGFGRWSGWHLAGVIVLVLTLIGLLILLGRFMGRRAKRATHIDRKAKLMGSPEGLGRDAAVKAAEVGRMAWAPDASPGLHYGDAILDGTPLFMNWRETGFFEIGMGGGKSSALIIPMVDQAPGNCVTTGMKRDLPDAIRWLCEERGEFYCFDPMPIADYHHGGVPKWWWNPLGDVDGPVAALRLATIFAEATAPSDASKHPFFDVKGPELLACLALAAAEEGDQIDQVYKWVQDPEDDYPATVLERRFPLSAAFLRGLYKMKGDSKGDLFATAGNAIGWMTDPNIQAWITDRAGRPEFKPADFVKPYAARGLSKEQVIKRDTLLIMSRKGDANVAPIAAALMSAVLKAGQVEATHWPHGRLPVPMVMPMDELPNTAPIPTLPDDFTVLGSHGITPILCVQNWAQATRAWKPAGAQQLWNGSTTRGVGAGLADAERLASISKLTGQCWEVKASSSVGGPNTTRQIGREKTPILDVDELGALDEGRFVALCSGHYGVLARLVPWWERPDLKPKIEKSLALYEPAGTRP